MSDTKTRLAKLEKAARIATSGEIRARGGVDRDDPRGEAAVADGPREEARRMARADLDDPPRPLPPHERIGRREQG